MPEKILALLKKLNLIPADKETEIKAALEKENLEPPKQETVVDTSKVTDPALRDFLQSLSDANKVLVQQVKDLTGALADEKKAREDAAKIQADRIKTERDQKYEKLIADAKKEGRLVEAKEKEVRDKFKDIESLEYHLNQLPVDKHAVPPDKGGSGTSEKNADGTPKQSQAIAQPFTPSRAGILDKVKQFSTVTDN